MPANGEEKQLINKEKPDNASLASEPSNITDKKEDYETLSPVVAPVTEKEERGPIKDRSCTDVLCLGENCCPTRIMENFLLTFVTIGLLIAFLVAWAGIRQ